MSLVTGVLACAALFVMFGALHRGRRPRIGCAACPGDMCRRECLSENATVESIDVSR